MGKLRDKYDIWDYIDCEECCSSIFVSADELLESNEEVVMPLSDITNVEDRFRLMCDLLNEPYTITKESLFKRLDDLLQ